MTSDKQNKDQLVWDGHLKEFIDQEKNKEEEAGAKLNPKFYRNNKEIDNILEEDLSLGTIHMIGGWITLILRTKLGGRFVLSDKWRRSSRSNQWLRSQGK